MTTTGKTNDRWAGGRIDEIDALDQARSFARVATALGVTVELPRVGPYSILERIGAGGMGIVYAAFDPELKRRVAVKLLRSGQREQHDRLQKEARALARLAHPHVVAVHRVGAYEGQTFVAMALVEGTNLRAWARESTRTPQEVLRVFAEAGSGLAAAHDAGVIHRDFKPANVLIDTHGRARVADFGIAALASDDSRPRHATSDDLLATRSSHAIGTPAYMAPEQHAGEGAVPASDQFSWCVSLVDTLDGVLPYDASSIAQLGRCKAQGTTVRSPQTTISPRLWTVIERGLSPQPEDRYPGMRALLDAVDRASRTRARGPVAIAVVGAVAVASAVALGVRSQVEPEPAEPAMVDPCEAFAEQLVGVWDDEMRAQVAQRVEQTGLRHAPDVRARIEAAFDDQASGWVVRKEAACRAQRAGTLTGPAYDARQTCLDARLDQLRTAVTALETLDRAFVLRAPNPSPGDPLEDCDVPWDAYWLQRQHPREVERARAIESKLDEGAAQIEAGRIDEARAIYAQARAEIEASQEGFPSVKAELSRRQSQLEGDPARKQALLLEALLDALRTHHPRAAVPTTMDYAHLMRGMGDGVLAHELVDLGLAENRRYATVFEEDPAAQHWAPGFAAELYVQRGKTFDQQAQPKQALAAYQDSARALELVPNKYVRRRVHAYNNIAEAHRLLGEYAEAEPAYARAVEIAERDLGPHDPLLAAVLGIRGGAKIEAGRPAEALGDVRRAIEIIEGVSGPESIDLVVPVVNLALAEQARGDLDDALATFRRAKAIATKHLGPAHPFTAYATGMEGAVLREQGHFAQSLERLHPAVAAMQQVYPQGHANLGSMLSERSETQTERGDAVAALADAHAAIKAFDRSGGSKTVGRAVAQVALARALYLRGKHDEARAQCAAAIEHLAALGPSDRPELTRARKFATRFAPGGGDG